MVEESKPEEHHTVDDDNQPEEGEIVTGDVIDTSSSSTSAVEKHPLEHSWTFWFDNSDTKSKQTAWGSSMRPIYTFSTVEDFWRSRFTETNDWLRKIMKDDMTNAPKTDQAHCPNCGHNIVAYIQFQTRSVDEPMTINFSCEKFNHC